MPKSKMDAGAELAKLLSSLQAEAAKPGDMSPKGEAIGDELEKLAWNIARIPTSNRDGLQLQAAIYAHFTGMPLQRRDGDSLQTTLLKNILAGLLSNTPYRSLLDNETRELV